MQNPIEVLKERATIQELAFAAAECANTAENPARSEAYRELKTAFDRLAETMQHLVGNDPANPVATVAAPKPEEVAPLVQPEEEGRITNTAENPTE